MKKQGSLFSIIFAIFCFGACNEQTGVLAKETSRTDKSILTDNAVWKEEVPITLFVVRHAEKQTGTNPSLTENGKQRAIDLAHFLENIPIDAIYSSNYKRTEETVMPTATQKNIAITTYDPGQLSKVASDLLAIQASKTVLLVMPTKS